MENIETRIKNEIDRIYRIVENMVNDNNMVTIYTPFSELEITSKQYAQRIVRDECKPPAGSHNYKECNSDYIVYKAVCKHFAD